MDAAKTLAHADLLDQGGWQSANWSGICGVETEFEPRLVGIDDRNISTPRDFVGRAGTPREQGEHIDLYAPIS
jgi:hypothetical protein